jgi:thiol-disulfide isomerase/thioredoxin
MRRRVDQPKCIRVMGRLPSLRARWALASSVVLGLACNQEPKGSTTRERSEIVQASGSAPVAAPVAPSTPTPSAPAAESTLPHKLCEGQLGRTPRDAPKKPVSRKAAQGAKQVGAVTTAGHWTWINLWAAWCAPCKEEIPRLVGFASRFAQAGSEVHLSFVSLDDDERQLEQFLAAQPDTGVRSTFWLREGHERDDWLAAAGLKRDPSLPVQLLVDPKGKVRCAVSGAVTDKDYDEMAALVASP